MLKSAFVLGFLAVGLHFGFAAFWSSWSPMLPAHPALASINRGLVAPSALAVLSTAHSSPIAPDALTHVARWLIGGVS